MIENILIFAILVLSFVIIVIARVVWTSYKKEKGCNKLEQIIPDKPFPPPPYKPMYCEWIYFDRDVLFRKKEIKCLTKNPNGTINIVMDGVAYNTGMTIDEVMLALTEHSEDAHSRLRLVKN